MHAAHVIDSSTFRSCKEDTTAQVKFGNRKPAHKRIFILCVVLVYTHWDPPWCCGVSALYLDSLCVIYVKRLDHLWRYPGAVKVMKLEEKYKTFF